MVILLGLVKAKKKQLEKSCFGGLLVHHRDADPPIARVFKVVGVVGCRVGYTFNLGKSIARNTLFLNDLSSFLGTLSRQ